MSHPQRSDTAAVGHPLRSGTRSGRAPA